VSRTPAVAVLAWLGWLCGCAGAGGGIPPRNAPPDVVLVSLDTTRADVVDAVTTPNLEALAARGARFRWAFAHAPGTASSHASVFTGLDPHGHGVARNGHALGADRPTLAGTLAAAGWTTCGVVGADVLDGSTGLGRGFARWDAPAGGAAPARHERPADRVTSGARACAAAAPADRPLLLFVHYFDAHAPYAAPPPWTDGPRSADGRPPPSTVPGSGGLAALARVGAALREGRPAPRDLADLRARYRGEVAWVDEQLGALLRGVAEVRAGRDPVIAVFGDHGEGLGEPGPHPMGHGPSVDLSATHVPLVLAGPGVPRGVVSDDTVALSDLGTTLLALAGVPGPLGDGRDLRGAWTGALPPRPVFLEATQPAAGARDGAWPNLHAARGVVEGDRMLRAVPWRGEQPGLYRRAPGQPPMERTADVEAATARMAARLAAWDAAGPRGAAPVPAQAEVLEALGYTEPPP
jgi:arylsulfatase